MLNIHFYSNGSEVARSFRSLNRSKRYELSVFDLDSPQAALEHAADADFAYLDVSHVSTDRLVSVARRLARRARRPFGLVHASADIDDPSRLFFAGVADFVGKAVLEKGVTTSRMDEVFRYLDRGPAGPSVPEAGDTADAEGTDAKEADAKEAHAPRYLPSGSDWHEIEPAREYTFWFLFAELDNVKAYSDRASDSNTEELVAAFHRHLSETVAPHGGHLWIWKKTGGIVLFPFDGRRCTPIVPIMRLVLNRAIDSVEKYPLNSELSFRLALHLGNTVYESQGRTGGIVAETVNFAFHLGQRHIGPGATAITAAAFEFVPDELVPYFTASGSFEGHEVYLLKRLSTA